MPGVGLIAFDEGEGRAHVAGFVDATLDLFPDAGLLQASRA